MMYYVYVLQSRKDRRLYTGSTNDLRKRFKEHNDGKVFSTKSRVPFELIYYEACINEQDARTREKYLKSGPGKKYLGNRMKRFLSLTGFTFIEVLITVTIIVALSLIVIVSINPNQYLAKGRDTQRKGHILIILNAVGQRIADNKGVFETGCAAEAIPTTATKMAVGVGNYDVGPCLVPIYLPNMPFDPKASGAHWTSITDYDTRYTIVKDATTGRITVAAPSAELETINYTR